MMFAYLQRLDPLAGKIFWSPLWSTLLSALPVLVLFWLLVPRRWMAYKAGAAGTLTAIVIAVFVYGMPMEQACWSFIYGAGFGLLPVGWTIFQAMLLYNITVETGQFTIVRRSVAKLSGDARIQSGHFVVAGVAVFRNPGCCATSLPLFGIPITHVACIMIPYGTCAKTLRGFGRMIG